MKEEVHSSVEQNRKPGSKHTGKVIQTRMAHLFNK